VLPESDIAGDRNAVLRRLRTGIVVGVPARASSGSWSSASISSSLKPTMSRLSRPPGATPVDRADSSSHSGIHRQTIVRDPGRGAAFSGRGGRGRSHISVIELPGASSARDGDDTPSRADGIGSSSELDNAAAPGNLLLRMRPRIADVGIRRSTCQRSTRDRARHARVSRSFLIVSYLAPVFILMGVTPWRGGRREPTPRPAGEVAGV